MALPDQGASVDVLDTVVVVCECSFEWTVLTDEEGRPVEDDPYLCPLCGETGEPT